MKNIIVIISVVSTILLLSCVKNRRLENDKSDDYQKLTIEDSTLLKIFNKSDPCKKLEIMIFFKKDLLPSGEGYADSLISVVESLTRTVSHRRQTHFGLGYNSADDLEKDFAEWSEILNCK